MKWKIWIHDPENIFNDETVSEERKNFFIKYLKDGKADVFFVRDNSPGELLDLYIKDREKYERCIMIYDGNYWLDSIANDCIYAVVYKKFHQNVGHHTSNIIDGWLDTPYEKGNEIKMLAEILHIYYSKFNSEKTDLIEDLKKLF